MSNRILYIITCISLVWMSACGNRNSVFDFEPSYTPVYASGFEIFSDKDSDNSLIVTYNSWQGSRDSGTELFISRNGTPPPENFSGQVIFGDASRIVCMSSSHVAMLEAVGAVEDVVGVSGIDYICNPFVARNRNEIADIGFDGNVDYETLIDINPDIVLLFGISGASPMEPKLRELGIPFIYVGEYLEESPLGKAEWMVAVAELTGKRREAVEIFEEIPVRYDSLRQVVKSLGLTPPKVMINAPYADSWFMASTQSYVALLIADAGGDYLYTRNTSDKSLPIDTEEALMLVSEADIWLNVNDIRSIDELRSRMPNFADTKCVQNGAVYNCDRRLNEFGGNDYWESAVVQPDIVLRDLIKIMHPQLVSEDFTYYRQLTQ